MFGNILGDTVGSVYEYNNIYTKDFPFIGTHNYPTDDTVCSVAIADWLLHGGDVARTMRQWCQGYPSANYGPMFRNWVEDESAEPYGSKGNGAPMRVGAVALWYAKAEDAYAAATDVTNITHNDPESIHAVKAVVAMQRYAAKGARMDELRKVATKFYGNDVLIDMDTLRNRQGPHFDPCSKGTAIQAIVCFLNSESVEDAIRNCVSIGGDCDTSACIAGGIAEAFYGFPEEWLEPLMARVPLEMRTIVINYYGQRAIKPIVFDAKLLRIPFVDEQSRSINKYQQS